MPSSKDSCHRRMLARFEAMTVRCERFRGYAPGRSDLESNNFRAALGEARAAILGCVDADASNRIAIADRELAYEPLPGLVARVKAALRATGSDEGPSHSVDAIFRQIGGRPRDSSGSDPARPADPHLHGHPAQLPSHEAGHADLGRLIPALLEAGFHSHSDPELSVSALQALYQLLEAKNSAVLDSEVALGKARARRDAAFLRLVELASDCKTYVLSKYGSNSPEYGCIPEFDFLRSTSGDVHAGWPSPGREWGHRKPQPERRDAPSGHRNPASHGFSEQRLGLA